MPGARVEGLENADATARAGIVILSVPFEHTAGTIKSIRERLEPGQIVVSMGVPLASAVGDAASRMIGVWQGSCAELVAALVPEGVHVVSAFQNVSAHRLQHLAEPVECDVVVSGEKEPRARVIELCALVPGLRGIDGGPLANARIVESITAMLIGLNIRYRVSEGIGIRFTGIPTPSALSAGITRLNSRGCESDGRRPRAGTGPRAIGEEFLTSPKSHLRSISCAFVATQLPDFVDSRLTRSNPRSTQAKRG